VKMKTKSLLKSIGVISLEVLLGLITLGAIVAILMPVYWHAPRRF